MRAASFISWLEELYTRLMPRSTVGHVWKLRHRRYWDLTGVKDKAHRDVIQDALNACDYPFSRIRKVTGKRVTVTVSDLTRYSQALTEGKGHAHIESDAGEIGHLLGAQEPAIEPVSRAHGDEHHEPDLRYAALGLYWLPTTMYPAGRVELERSIMTNKPLAMEVFLAEAAHAVDYGAMTDDQRTAVLARFHDNPGDHHHPSDWFEEGGEYDYYDWAGERFMGLFMAAFAPSLSRPLENRQPWTHSYDQADIQATRKILL